MLIAKEKIWIMTALTAGFIALLVTDVARESPGNGPCRTEPIRRNLHRLQKILFTAEGEFEALRLSNEDDQRIIMHRVVRLMKAYLLPHLAAEESVLYPAVDRRLPAPSASMTQIMVGEHAIMRRWLEEMEDLATRSTIDAHAFVRRGERLLGLIECHFELDEGLLFPILDQAPPLARP